MGHSTAIHKIKVIVSNVIGWMYVRQLDKNLKMGIVGMIKYYIVKMSDGYWLKVILSWK